MFAIFGVFIPIILGFLVKEIHYFDANLNKPLRMFVLRIAVPSLIMTSMYKANLQTLKQLLPVAFSFVIITIILMILSGVLLFFMKNREKKTIYMLGLVFSNYAWIGWAVLKNRFGVEGFNRGVFFVTFWWPVLLMGGLLIAFVNKIFNTKKFPLQEYLLNILVPIGALIVGITFNLLHFSLPEILYKSLHSLGEMTVPLILFSVGLSISFKHSLGNLKELVPLSILKPILGALAGILTLLILPISDPISRKTILLEVTMPVASLLPVLGDMFELDQKLISSFILISTLFSLISIPIAIYLIK